MAQDRGNETIVVTGAGSGIGYGLARRLLDEGYRVSGWDVEAGKLDGINDDRLSFHRIDVRDKVAMTEAVDAELEIGAAIAGLATCAAIYKSVPFLELDEETWDAHFAINLKGSLFACQAVLPFMRQQQSGSIVLFSSMIARAGGRGGGHYAATKGGVLGLTRSMALDYAREGIRVNVISPGITDTAQPRGNMSEEAMYAMAEVNPMKRIGQPEDMAETALFLLGDDASFVTGQDIRVNGGRTMF